MAKWVIPDNQSVFGEKPKKENVDVAIGVTLGNGNTFAIDTDGHMFIGPMSKPGPRVYLGKSTLKNFHNLVGSMKRLQTHMTEE